MIPKCTKMLMNCRHHSPLNVSGPKSAPQRIAFITLGALHETPLKPIAKYTSTFKPMIARVTGGTLRKIIQADVCGAVCPGTALLTAAGIFAFRQSAHSVAVCDPIEKPLNDFLQLGQMGTLAIPFSARANAFDNPVVRSLRNVPQSESPCDELRGRVPIK